MQQEEDFKKYMDAFEKKLECIIIDNISAEQYCKKYLAHLLQHRKYYLAIYADVLYKLIQHSSKSKENILLIDYGTGNGLLGIFAKFSGFKKVFLSDIDANFIHASEKLATQLNIKMDGYLTGDISVAQVYFKNETPDAIIGTDVIEHIYNLQVFFKGLQNLNQSIVSVFTTASNPVNYFKVRMLKKMQLRDELEGTSDDDPIPVGDAALEPFLKTRERIIRDQINDLPDEKISALAKATRGMIEQDILKAVEEYKISGRLPSPPAHATNTCNPLNGSWTERILSLNEYISLYTAAGFTCKFYAGFYNAFEGRVATRFVKKLLNALIIISGKKFSAYIVIAGFKK